MPSSMNWVDGIGGGTPISAANLNKLAVVADIPTAGTATGDALRAAFDARYTPPTSLKTFYIAPSTGSDSNIGTTPAQAFATLAAAKTAAAGAAARYILVGTLTVSAADGSGNGFTLDQQGSVLEGLGAGMSIIKIATTATWGVAAAAALCTVRGIQVQTIAGGAVTYGMGVTTANKTSGTAESCTFRDCYVQVTAGTMTNGYAVGADTTGGSIDIAETLFENCQSRGVVSNAGFLIGNGTSANILNTTLRDCTAVHGAYGVYADHSNVIWSGAFGVNSTTDIYLNSVASGPYTFKGVRSEGSARLLQSVSTSNTLILSLEDILWSADSINADGKWILHGLGGSLRMGNVKCYASGSATPVISLTTPGWLTVNANGIQTSQPLSGVFSFSGSQILINNSGYVQLSSTGSDLPVAASGAGSYPSVTKANPAAPTGTVSTTAVMMGLAVAFTPQTTGKVLIILAGQAGSSSGPNTLTIHGQYGTGTAPANGAASTGTGFANGYTLRPAIASGGVIEPFTLIDKVTLTPGTTYWFDLSVLSGSAAATANVGNLTLILEEVN